jgi:hypothetical protein
VTGNGPPFAVGAKVRLRHCAFGEPGTVLRIERGKLVVHWHDLDHQARHSPESLVLAAEKSASYTSCSESRPVSCAQGKEKTKRIISKF